MPKHAHQLAPHHVAFLNNYMQCKPMVVGPCSDTTCNVPNPMVRNVSVFLWIQRKMLTFLTIGLGTLQEPTNSKLTQRLLADRQWRNKSSTDSESSLQIKHRLNNVLPLFCKLSQVRILPWEAFYTKNDTLNGAGDFQMMLRGKPPFESEED